MRSPCGMYGYCKPLSRTSYICVCDVGYYGDHCQRNTVLVLYLGCVNMNICIHNLKINGGDYVT